MLILGFDPSKTTGWALFDTSKPLSAIQCGVLEMPDKADEYFTADQLALKVKELVRRFGHTRIDFAVLEEQSRAQIGGSGASGIIYPWVTTSAIISTLANFKIAYGTIPPGTWRKMFFGQGFKPPKDAKQKNDWKAAAINQCELEGIALPPQKAKAHNAAEAVAVAVCWREAKIHARRYEAPLMALKMRRNDRSAA